MHWAKWQQQMKHNPDRITWCKRYVKRMIRLLFIQEGSERRRDRSTMENFYYEALYAILQETHQHETSPLKQPKARIVRLHSTGQRRVLGISELDKFAGEEPTLYHLLKMRRRQESRMVHRVRDNYGNTRTTKDILRTFVAFMRGKYEDVAVEEGSVKYMA